MLFGLLQKQFPRENMLRVSDGKWTTNKILRAIAFSGSDTSLLIGRTITGQSSGATAVVEAVSKFQIGANEITEFTIGVTILLQVLFKQVKKLEEHNQMTLCF